MTTPSETSDCTKVKQLLQEKDRISQCGYIHMNHEDGGDKLCCNCVTNKQSLHKVYASNDITGGSLSTNGINSVCKLSELENGYIHPIQELSRNGSNACKHVYSEPQFSRQVNRCTRNESSTSDSYAIIQSCRNSSKCSQTHLFQTFNENNNTAFKKGFCLLLSLNVLFFLSYVIGVPLVYASSERFDTCFKCDMLPMLTKEDLARINVGQDTDGTCCLESSAGLLKLLIKGLPGIKDVERNHKLLNILLARKRSAIEVIGLKLSNSRIFWSKHTVNEGDLTYNSSGIQISVGGTYALYSRVHFRTDLCQIRRKLGYRVELEGEKEAHKRTLASVKDFCLNGTKQDFTVQTIFQVPLGQTLNVYIHISKESQHFVNQHHYHSLSVFEI
ncbi:uncharacterized protein LOC132756238 [Ruditapes philippinarum]|uniref:uncharacterized protein LOC132756238 n=1 Tax=Ruditapes philippinarum TaxID=129788 RepID=UPI00295A78F4|nr:uncharacterized protein LOC132756238 [Ruditapes philippinarum]